MRAILITGVTLAQGQGKEHGKQSERYRESAALCEIDEDDLKTLGVGSDQNVRLTSPSGSIVLRAVKSKEKTPGLVFVPTGPWANVLVSSKTDGTGMPHYKGFEVEVEAAPSERVLSLKELVEKIRG